MRRNTSLRARLLGVGLLLVAVLVSLSLLLSRQVAVNQFEDFVQRGQSRETQAAVAELQGYVNRTGSLEGIGTALDEMHGRTGSLILLLRDSQVIASGPSALDTVDISGNAAGLEMTVRANGLEAQVALGGDLPALVDTNRRHLASVVVVPFGEGGPRREFGGQVDRRLVLGAVVIGALGVLLTGFAAGRLARPVEAALRRNEELRRNLLNDVAHELRTPLGHVRAELEALQDGLRPPAPEVIDRLHADAIHLQRLVDDLRDLAQAEAGQLHLEVETIDLGEALAIALRAFAPAAAERDIRITDAVPPDLHVRADRSRLRQILANLLENAIRHARDAGSVTIAAAVDARDVRITVTDDGTGVPDEHVAHLFDRFYRVDQSRDRRTGGVGLGLAIVRQLVTVQGGTASAANVTPHGLSVSFTLPRS